MPFPTSGFLSALGQAFQGYGQDQDTRFKRDQLTQERARQSTLDQDTLRMHDADIQRYQTDAQQSRDQLTEQRRVHDAEIGNYQAEAQKRAEEVARAARTQSTIQQHWAHAITGNKDSQAAITSVAPQLASMFEPKPTQDEWVETQEVDHDGHPYLLNRRTGEKRQGVGTLANKTGAAGERSGMAAAFLSRLNMGKADFENDMDFIRNFHQRAKADPNTITPWMMAQGTAAESRPSADSKGLPASLGNAMQGGFQGWANQNLGKSEPDYQRYRRAMSRISTAMTEVLPRPTQKLIDIEKGMNSIISGDTPETIDATQRRLDKAYEFLFKDPQALLTKGASPGMGGGDPHAQQRMEYDAAAASLRAQGKDPSSILGIRP